MSENKTVQPQAGACFIASAICAAVGLLLLLLAAAAMPDVALLQKHTAAAGEGVALICALAAGWASKRHGNMARPLIAGIAAAVITAAFLLTAALFGSDLTWGGVLRRLGAGFIVSFAGTFLAGRRNRRGSKKRKYKL